MIPSPGMLTDSCLKGSAGLRIASVAGRSAVVRAWSRSPIRLLTPRADGPSVSAFTSSYGGGMVAGDETSLEARVDEGARCFLGTQSSTKIYRNPLGLPCSHRLAASVGQEALLVMAPDPVQCFAESHYRQHQRFELERTSNLALVDWMSAGRIARGERWAFHRYFSRNEVFREGKLIFLDPLLLDRADGSLASPFRGGAFNCLATVLLLGPQLEAPARRLLAEIAEQAVAPGAALICAASPCQEGAVLRLAGPSVEEVGKAIRRCLSFLPQLLDNDPWARKW